MAKHHQQPRPTAPPSPMQQRQAVLPHAEAPKYDATAPVLTAVGLGRTEDGRHACALLKTQGRTLLSCRLFGPPARSLEVAEEMWRASAYQTLYLGEVLPTVDGMLHEGKALAMHKLPDSRTAVVLLELEDGKLLPPDADRPTLYTGKRGEAWETLDDWASHNLLLSTLAERRRRAAGA